MAWSTIRKATEDEISKLNAAAERIARQFKFPSGDCIAWDMSYWKTGYASYDKRFQQAVAAQAAYRRAVRRILGGSAEGISYGYVGYHVN